MQRLTAIVICSLALVPSAFSQGDKLSRPQRELVEAERAFARYTVENGIPESWMEFFADDGIIFRPGPVNSKDFYRKKVPSPRPLPGTLNWEPRHGDVSQAGDLGYSMGPWTFVSNAVPREPDVHGYYFSIWKKQGDGKWKVAMDFGSGEITDPNFDHSFGKPFMPARQYTVRVSRGTDRGAELQKLKGIDQGLAKSSQSARVVKSYLALIADDAWTFKPGKAPANKESLRSYIHLSQDGSLILHPIGGDIAKSADMAYTYGDYELREGGDAKEKGYYVHLWKRDRSGKWKIVVTNLTGQPK